MTQQHLIGELSLILGELQAVSTNEATVREIASLRREAETGAFGALPSVTARALELTHAWWRESLLRGDSAASGREAAICTELWEFAVSAGLVEEVSRDSKGLIRPRARRGAVAANERRA